MKVIFRCDPAMFDGLARPTLVPCATDLTPSHAARRVV
jgi:hypothetical protein